MSDKITVTFEADPAKTYLVKPLGEKLAETTEPVSGDPELTGTITAGKRPHRPDQDIDTGI
jgi:hypothetical protein